MKRKHAKSKDVIANPEDVPLYVGVDIHERESQLAVFERSGSLLMEKRIPTSNLESFVSSLLGEKHVAVESVGFIYPIYDRLSKLSSCRVSVANPSRVGLIAKSRLKHDKADARALGELLRTNFLPTSYMPDEQTKEERLLVNDKVRYGLRKGELKGSIKWLLKRKGIVIESPFSAEGRGTLRKLRLREIDIRLDELALIKEFMEIRSANKSPATVEIDGFVSRVGGRRFILRPSLAVDYGILCDAEGFRPQNLCDPVHEFLHAKRLESRETVSRVPFHASDV